MTSSKELKKILYVLDNFPKLSETFVLNEMVELIKRGYEIKIFSLVKPSEETVNEDIKNFNMLERTFYPIRKNVLKSVFEATFYFYLWKFFTIFLKRKNRLFYLNFPRGGSRILFPFRVLVNLSALANEHRDSDIIHSHFAANASMYGLLLSEVLDKPFTITAHAYEIFCNPDIEILKMKIKRSKCAMTPSLYNRKYIEKITGLENNNIQIIRATIDPEKFKPSNGVDNGIFKIISVGRMVEKKGFEFLIGAMKTLRKKYPNVLLNIVGTGPLENKLKELVKEYGLQGHVQLVGALSNEECKNLLKESSVAVLPCVVSRDGDRDVCPLTLQEAMAMELPVVSTSVGSIPELVDDGINGILVEEKNQEALANSVITLIENPELRLKLGKNGREKILKEFNIKKQVDRLLLIWNEIVSDHKGIVSFGKNFDPYAYWSERAKKHGKVAVGNLGKSEDEFEHYSKAGKEKLLPFFSRYLSGREKTLLDFGCGYGRFTSDIGELVGGEVWGLDATPELIEIAEQENKNPRVSFKVSRGSIPFGDGFFDVVWVSYVLEHIFGREKEKAAEDLRRILKPGGLIFIIENTAIWKKANQCDIRHFKWYKKVFSPIHFEITTLPDLKTIKLEEDLKLLEEDRKKSNMDLTLIMAGRKPN